LSADGIAGTQLIYCSSYKTHSSESYFFGFIRVFAPGDFLASLVGKPRFFINASICGSRPRNRRIAEIKRFSNSQTENIAQFFSRKISDPEYIQGWEFFLLKN